jgi:transposase-like protein
MRKTRKHYSAAEKAAILREHLIDHVPVSDLCDKHGIHPTLFYQWQRTLFENLPALFERGPGRSANGRIDSLQRKLAHKDQVIAAIMEDFIAVKKGLGES